MGGLRVAGAELAASPARYGSVILEGLPAPLAVVHDGAPAIPAQVRADPEIRVDL